MIRCPHRINFRLTAEQYDRYRLMIGELCGIQNWTNLCLKALGELARTYKGSWSMALDAPKYDGKGQSLELFSVCQLHDSPVAKQAEKVNGLPRPSKNGKHKATTTRPATTRPKKKLAKRPGRK